MYSRLLKHFMLALGLLGPVLAQAPEGRAQLLGGLSTGAVETPGAQKIGGVVGITDDFVSLSGMARIGIASSFDLGAKVAYVDFKSPLGTSLGLNADAKIQILDVFLQDPFDLAVGPEMSYFRIADVTNWYFGAYVAGSKEFILTNGRGITPYARIGLRLHRAESDAAQENELNSGVGAGVAYEIAGYTSIWGELSIEDAGTGVFIGFLYELR
jgi:hypothetical protein